MEHENLSAYIDSLCGRSRAASTRLAAESDGTRTKLVLASADSIEAHADSILASNEEDLRAAKAAGMSDSLLDRLALSDKRLKSVAAAMRDVAALPSPVGAGSFETRPNGLQIRHVKVPFGVVAMIYEARPNVTADAAALCLKSGNAVILKGGKEAFRSNLAITTAIREGIASCGMDPDAVSILETTDRAASDLLIRQRGRIDLLIPRGGRGLIRYAVENATVPVIETGAGNCHLYVDRAADLDMALSVTMNAKTSRPSVCNAIETLLVHRDVADLFLPRLAADAAACGLELRGCEKTRAILPDAKPATDDDWATEYDDMILAVRVVDSLDDAIGHIRTYSTGHSEGILTSDMNAAERFTSSLDAAAVYVNASTRFTDGGEFGLGAEIGISTQKMHVRGPMGLGALTTDKYIIYGNGQIR